MILYNVIKIRVITNHTSCEKDPLRNSHITRSDALLPKSSANDSLQNLVLVMDYHPNFRGIPKLIRDHLSILYESPCMKKVFSNDKTRIRTGFRRTKNLKDLLVSSGLPDLNRVDTLNSDVIGCFRCNRKVCDAFHNLLLPSKRIKSVATGESYKIRQSLSCRTDYIIYCAMCLLCNGQCVGSSVDFWARLSNHKSHIKQKKRTCRLVNHFIHNAHDRPLSGLKFVLIEQVSIKTEEFLEQRERYWHAQLWTYERYGFNAKKEFNSGRRREFLS